MQKKVQKTTSRRRPARTTTTVAVRRLRPATTTATTLSLSLSISPFLSHLSSLPNEISVRISPTFSQRLRKRREKYVSMTRKLLTSRKCARTTTSRKVET
ncbi:hypothetical protein Csa_012341 [Cucumis sativus]|uniref:Uncharacterized protein n=1 Tax=Cucumis sativus TaxID=3659 RepID=A0A0A0L0Y2_CUCSA|nr:hypothetical protein Csa_012341 [Cucumis sativus]